ncbi:MAG: FAD-dependent oxidoreductase [Verrucomicrobiota bacterium]|nr:FAD-dependent oxidoreductase [Verrucomicrobiota bacterium]
MARSLHARLTSRFGRPASVLERREFLRLALAASVGLLVRPGQLGARALRRRFIVIGGGFSGLACAHQLMEAGCEVLVLEARTRVGGRVRSFHDLLPGRVVEGGGELIGSNHPTWMAYAKKFGLHFNDVTEDENLSAPIVLGGRRVPLREAKALWEELETAHKLLAAEAEAIDADEPWLSPRARELDARPTADWIRAVPISPNARRVLTVELAADNGVATARQSFLGSLTQVKGGGLEKYWTESEVYRCRGGNAQLAQRLARALGDERLRLGLPVREVRVSEDKVTVRDATGALHEADDVVLAIPPSTWRQVKFLPSLPAILRPQMGVNVKYLAVVQGRFWRREGLSPDSISEGIASMTWDATDNQGSDGNGAVLTSFSGGPAAERARKLFAQKGEAAYAEALREMYPHFPKNFRGGRFMNWPNELWTRAGYSFPAPGQVTTVGPILRRGLGRLHFAGEHACYKFVGYMEGALNSGVSLAKRMIARESGSRRVSAERARITR